jgi:hypothetical protein
MLDGYDDDACFMDGKRDRAFILQTRRPVFARRNPPYFNPTPMNCVGPNGSILKPVTFFAIG